MCQFVESIKYLNGEYYNLEFHQDRMDKTRSVFYPDKGRILLSNILSSPDGLVQDQVYKCRVIYANNISNIIYEPYTKRVINQYYITVCPDEFDYTYKLNDRSSFDHFRKCLQKDEDFIYVKKGLITDTSYANLVFSDGENLFTPASTLLKGTKRAYYLKEGIIREEDIKVSDLQKFISFTTINAMLDLGSVPDYSCDKLLLSHTQLKL
jgi:4-amino-4-deoxychorismate lyase